MWLNLTYLFPICQSTSTRSSSLGFQFHMYFDHRRSVKSSTLYLPAPTHQISPWTLGCSRSFHISIAAQEGTLALQPHPEQQERRRELGEATERRGVEYIGREWREERREWGVRKTRVEPKRLGVDIFIRVENQYKQRGELFLATRLWLNCEKLFFDCRGYG